MYLQKVAAISAPGMRVARQADRMSVGHDAVPPSRLRTSDRLRG